MEFESNPVSISFHCSFNLDGLMVQGIGPIFLSHFEHDPEYRQVHHDLIEAKGSFYNVIVPLYIPEGGAKLYVGDMERDMTVNMRYNVGTLLGAGTRHGTAECDVFRLLSILRMSIKRTSALLPVIVHLCGPRRAMFTGSKLNKAACGEGMVLGA